MNVLLACDDVWGKGWHKGEEWLQNCLWIMFLDLAYYKIYHDQIWTRVLLHCLISIFMWVMHIRPRIWASSSNCRAPYSPRVIGLSQVFRVTSGWSSSGGWRRIFTPEIDIWQCVSGSVERKGVVQVTWPNGTAEGSGASRPQATGVAEDGLCKKKRQKREGGLIKQI